MAGVRANVIELSGPFPLSATNETSFKTILGPQRGEKVLIFVKKTHLPIWSAKRSLGRLQALVSMGSISKRVPTPKVRYRK
jgi:hypothetical protein